MFLLLSHPLDPNGYAWPGEPVVKIKQCTDVNETIPFCSFVSEVPNHFGTHMDAPRHFLKDGLSINELPIEYFCHTEVALLEIPKGKIEGIRAEDLNPYTNIIAKCSFILIRTGFEQYRDTNQDMYQNYSPFISKCAGIYLTENFPNLKGIGVDFLSIGTASNEIDENDSPIHSHRNLLGFFSGKFVCAIEDMHLSEIPAGSEIVRFFNLPLKIVGLDSSQVSCVIETK
ncbi:cyclase [Candidatus Epulonipiscium fishelsonii]|uniref:Cyclase n=1 Tax=Candidatus Epulonipiscium fishelsonii TaxID=77094 RepID=A0ACC8XF82_9FIRM|nr:cyclase [Epulopiscium sp. SCG-B11WGA-EpuloA1]ONI43252.1 cyclase [Epulopiscium sp. SCG-B05WGA-EpuloA1]